MCCFIDEVTFNCEASVQSSSPAQRRGPRHITVSVYAESWTDAVKRAVRLTDEMVPEDVMLGGANFAC